MTLSGKVAVITGAGSGIGRAVGAMMAARGAAVAAVDIDEASALETARSVVAAGGRALGLPADVSRAEDIDAAVDAAVAALGPLDIMVNNAGILDGYFNVDEMDLAVWEAGARHRSHQRLPGLQAGAARCCRAAADASSTWLRWPG